MRSFIVLIICCALWSSCRKTATTQLPAPTNTGSNVMGFKLNGQLKAISGLYSTGFFSLGRYGGVYYQDPVSYVDSGQAEIKAISNDGSIILDIHFMYDKGTGSYPIKSVSFTDTAAKVYIFDTSSNRTISITRYGRDYDAQNHTFVKIVSGTMAFDIADPTHTYHLTEGRFDIGIPTL